MKKWIALKWAEALRSNKYKQTRSVLRHNDGFCCLGVLCNLHAEANPKIAATQLDPARYLGEMHLLPLTVTNWAGMSYDAGIPTDGTDIRINGIDFGSLAMANDGGLAFADIADWIEANYEKL